MNADVEKRQEINEKDGTKDQYSLSEMGVKKDHDEEAAEDSPLKGEYGDSAHQNESKGNDANLPPKEGGKEGRNKGLREWLSKSRVKWWIAILVAVVLLTVVLVGTLLAVEDDDYDLPDASIRLLKLWPRPNRPRKVISFVHGTLPDEGKIWPELINDLDELIARYHLSLNRSKNVVECYGSMPPEGSVCSFDIRMLAFECTKSVNYGYDQGKPCVFLEFNNITDWQPEPYTTRDLESIEDLPEDLRYLYKPSAVFLDCQGDSLVDRENMGPIQYTPNRGFPTRYFPYRGQSGYMSPLVGVRFANPAVGVAISITCKLWAKNINHTDEAVPSGSLSFNLLVD